MEVCEFVTIADLARERDCDVRTVMDRIVRGVYPPLPGNQSGLKFEDKGWPRIFLESFFTEAGRQAALGQTVGGAG